MGPLLTTIGLSVFIAIVGIAVCYSALAVFERGGVRYYFNQLLVKVALACLNRVEFKSATNKNMLNVVRNEADCLKGCV